MTKLIVAFRNFVNPPKNEEKIVIFCWFIVLSEDSLTKVRAHLKHHFPNICISSRG